MSFLGGHRDSSGLGARPIRLPTEAVRSLVEQELVPDLKVELSRLQENGLGDTPIGSRVLAAARFALTTVRGESRIIIAQIESQERSGRSAKPVLGGVFLEKYPAVVVFVNGNLTPDQITKPSGWTDMMQSLSACSSEYCLPYAIYMMLLHELTHAADEIGRLEYDPKEIKTLTSPEDERYRAYLNDPAEVRAFMREVVEQARRLAWIVSSSSHAKDRQTLVKMAMKMSKRWGDIEEHLTPRNRALILKAVYDDFVREGLIR